MWPINLLQCTHAAHVLQCIKDENLFLYHNINLAWSLDWLHFYKLRHLLCIISIIYSCPQMYHQNPTVLSGCHNETRVSMFMVYTPIFIDIFTFPSSHAFCTNRFTGDTVLVSLFSRLCLTTDISLIPPGTLSPPRSRQWKGSDVDLCCRSAFPKRHKCIWV